MFTGTSCYQPAHSMCVINIHFDIYLSISQHPMLAMIIPVPLVHHVLLLVRPHIACAQKECKIHFVYKLVSMEVLCSIPFISNSMFDVWFQLIIVLFNNSPIPSALFKTLWPRDMIYNIAMHVAIIEAQREMYSRTTPRSVMCVVRIAHLLFTATFNWKEMIMILTSWNPFSTV